MNGTQSSHCLSSPHEHGLGGKLAHVAGCCPVGPVGAGLPQSAVNVGIVGVGGIWNGNQAVEASGEAGKGGRSYGLQLKGGPQVA